MNATQTEKKKSGFHSDIQIGAPGLDIAGLRTLAENEPEAFMGKMQARIDAGTFRWKHVRNIGHLFNALVDIDVKASMPIMGQMRTITTGAFPLLSGGLTVAGINDAYGAEPTIGEQLVTEMEDSKKITVMAGVHALDAEKDRVDETEDFPLIGASEEKFTIAHKRNGRRIAITAEMIEENDVAGIVARVDALGRFAAKRIEKQTLRRVCDIDGSGSSPAEPYVLHIGGSGVAIYQTDKDPLNRLSSSGNRIVNNALVDSTDLDNALTRLASFTDEDGDRIGLENSELQLVVPFALLSTAAKIRGSELEPAIENEVNNWGPRGRWQPRIVSSSRLDDLSTTAWYLGNFGKQFRRKWKLRLEYVSLQGTTEAFVHSRVAFQARVAWDVEIGAIDYVYVVQNLPATTPP